MDTIADFSAADDTIHLDNAIFTKLKTEGALKAKWFDVGKKAHDKNDYIVYNKKTGDLFYDKNGDHKGGAVKFAVLDGSPNDLSAADSSSCRAPKSIQRSASPEHVGHAHGPSARPVSVSLGFDRHDIDDAFWTNQILKNWSLPTLWGCSVEMCEGGIRAARAPKLRSTHGYHPGTLERTDPG